MKFGWSFVCMVGFAAGWISPVEGLADGASSLFKKAQTRFEKTQSIDNPTLKRKEVLQSISEFRQFLDTYSAHSERPKAYLSLGYLYEELAQMDQDRQQGSRSLHYFRELVRLFPQSPEIQPAYEGMAQVCETIFQDQLCKEEALQKLKVLQFNAKSPPSVQEPIALSRSDLMAIQVEGSSWNSMVRLSLNQVPSFEFHYLSPEGSFPPRFYVDLDNARLPRLTKLPSIPSESLFSAIRVGQSSENRVRVVLDLAPQITKSDLRALAQGSDILIQFYSKEKIEAKLEIFDPTLPSSSSPSPSSKEVTPFSAPSPAGKGEVLPSPVPKKVVSRFIIVIDPGHGGEDTGAIGHRGTREKDITLAIAKKLKARLLRTGKYDVLMTREGDQTLSLSDRTRFANRVGGNLFVSIHTDSSFRKTARGVSTFYLENSDDERALRVAMVENGELNKEKTHSQTSSEDSNDNYLQITKAALIKDIHTQKSAEFARTVQSALLRGLRKKYSKIDDMGVRSAGFYVLTGAEMPAILVETSFISHREEEQRLRKDSYQEDLSQAIFQGVEKYISSSKKNSQHKGL